MRLCIVIPMYNEQRLVRKSIETILHYTEKLPPVVTVLMVNDGSIDSTETIVKELLHGRKNGGVELISHFTNQGYGAALTTGIKFASRNHYDYILFMDSDLTNHPKYLATFHKRMIEGYDYIKATRYANGGTTVGVPLRHRLLSNIGNRLAKMLYGMPLTDLTNGFRAARVRVLEDINFGESGFAIIMEELYHVKKTARSFCDVPYVLTSRGDSQGKSKFSYGPRTYYHYLKYPVKSLLESRKYRPSQAEGSFRVK